MEALWATILFSGFALEVIIRLYKKAINLWNSKIKNASWLINPIPTNLQPFDIELRGGKISANDYDRLLVAYGLCTGLLRKAEDDRRAENQIEGV